tara:strand:- start:924 stop:1406 length:483 start_codon:yes stop_codon:yes gene_type:complete
MIHYVFDLDDTLILHKNQIYTSLFMYDWIQEDKELSYALDRCKGEKYIYTNGTLGHAIGIIEKMNIRDKFIKVYSRDTIEYMKPRLESFRDVHNDISHKDIQPKVIFFFDDRLENLRTASQMGWYTIWIHPNYSLQHMYNYVNLAFGNIKDALSFLEKTV